MYLSNSESIIISRFLEVWYLQENGACRSRLDQCKPFITVNYEGAQNVSFVISSQLKFDPFHLVWCHNLVFVFLSGQKLTTHLLDHILYWRFMCWLIVPWHLVFIFWNLSNRKCFPCWISDILVLVNMRRVERIRDSYAGFTVVDVVCCFDFSIGIVVFFGLKATTP